jgi:hypothetical protein
LYNALDYLLANPGDDRAYENTINDNKEAIEEAFPELVKETLEETFQ